jgi:hypothetical protein
VAHVEKTAFRQPIRSAPAMSCAFQEQDAEEYFTQVSLTLDYFFARRTQQDLILLRFSHLSMQKGALITSLIIYSS